MKTLLKYTLFALLALVTILLVNTFRTKSKQMLGVPLAPTISISDSAVSHLAEAIRYRTVSYTDVSLMDSTQFEKFLAFVQKTYPLTHALKHERVGGFSLLFEWPGKNTTVTPAMLMGHYDVVPVVQGTEKMWKNQPFAGKISEGFVYGRGSLDDKSTVIGILEAIEHLLKQGYQPERTFYIAFGHDEEVSGRNGAKNIVKLLENRKIELEYIIDEGGTIKIDGISGLNKPLALVGIAEKGYTSLKLTALGDGGHSSMPPAQTSIGMLAEAVSKLQQNPFPTSLGVATQSMFDYIGPEMAFGQKLAMSNRWLFGSIIQKSLIKSNSGAASIRTTTAPTMINAGIKDNVLPIEATAVINFRILPSDSIKGVLDYVKKTIDNERITVETLKEFDSEPSPIADTASTGFRVLHRTIKSCFPDVTVSPYLVLAATDCRFYRNVCKNSFRFMPVRMNEEDLKRPHGTNERISTDDFKNVVKFYVNLVKNTK
jgi:carboxypeptidase PM20D1